MVGLSVLTLVSPPLKEGSKVISEEQQCWAISSDSCLPKVRMQLGHILLHRFSPHLLGQTDHLKGQKYVDTHKLRILFLTNKHKLYMSDDAQYFMQVNWVILMCKESWMIGDFHT